MGPEIVHQTAEKLKVVRERVIAAYSRQNSYVDKKRYLMAFKVRDLVLLKVSPWKGLVRFRMTGKLSLQFLGPLKCF